MSFTNEIIQWPVLQQPQSPRTPKLLALLTLSLPSSFSLGSPIPSQTTHAPTSIFRPWLSFFCPSLPAHCCFRLLGWLFSLPLTTGSLSGFGLTVISQRTFFPSQMSSLVPFLSCVSILLTCGCLVITPMQQCLADLLVYSAFS